MTHLKRLIGAVAVAGLLAMPAWAGDHGGQTTDGSQHAQQAVRDYVAPSLTATTAVEPVHLFARGRYVGRPYYGDRYYDYYAPRRFDRGYAYHGRDPWIGFYRPYYNRGAVVVGPVGVWW